MSHIHTHQPSHQSSSNASQQHHFSTHSINTFQVLVTLLLLNKNRTYKQLLGYTIITFHHTPAQHSTHNPFNTFDPTPPHNTSLAPKKASGQQTQRPALQLIHPFTSHSSPPTTGSFQNTLNLTDLRTPPFTAPPTLRSPWLPLKPPFGPPAHFPPTFPRRATRPPSPGSPPSLSRRALPPPAPTPHFPTAPHAFPLTGTPCGLFLGLHPFFTAGSVPSANNFPQTLFNTDTHSRARKLQHPQFTQGPLFPNRGLLPLTTPSISLPSTPQGGASTTAGAAPANTTPPHPP